MNLSYNYCINEIKTFGRKMQIYFFLFLFIYFVFFENASFYKINSEFKQNIKIVPSATNKHWY